MPASTDPLLTAREWDAVAAVLQKAHSCGCTAQEAGAPAAIWRRALDRLFARRALPSPADPRLEAVRRFVCATRRRREPAIEHGAPLAAHGFSRAQIEALGLLSR